jgi:hypothetical protein
MNRDVRPFVWAAQLDGNPVNPTWLFFSIDGPIIREGEAMRKYFEVRPPLAGKQQEVPSGTCITPGPQK